MALLTSPITGNGTTFALTTAVGQVTFVKKISGLENTLDGFAIDHLATTGFKDRKKLDLADPGKLTIECFHIGSETTLGSTGTATVTYPSAGSLTGTGWISKVKMPDAENGVALAGSFEWTFDGVTGPTITWLAP
jgi:hypothetical protein